MDPLPSSGGVAVGQTTRFPVARVVVVGQTTRFPVARVVASWLASDARAALVTALDSVGRPYHDPVRVVSVRYTSIPVVRDRNRVNGYRTPDVGGKGVLIGVNPAFRFSGDEPDRWPSPLVSGNQTQPSGQYRSHSGGIPVKTDLVGKGWIPEYGGP